MYRGPHRAHHPPYTLTPAQAREFTMVGWLNVLFLLTIRTLLFRFRTHFIKIGKWKTPFFGPCSHPPSSQPNCTLAHLVRLSHAAPREVINKIYNTGSVFSASRCAWSQAGGLAWRGGVFHIPEGISSSVCRAVDACPNHAWLERFQTYQRCPSHGSRSTPRIPLVFGHVFGAKHTLPGPPVPRPVVE